MQLFTMERHLTVDTTENELNICPEKLENYLVKNTKIVNNNCINKKTGEKNRWNNCCSYLWSYV